MKIQPQDVHVYNVEPSYTESDFGDPIPKFGDTDVYRNDILSKLTIKLTNMLNSLGKGIIQTNEVITGLDVKLYYYTDINGVDHLQLNILPGRCYIDRTTILLPSGVYDTIDNARSKLGTIFKGKLCFFLLYRFSSSLVSTEYTEKRYSLVPGKTTFYKDNFPPSPNFYRSLRPNTSDELNMKIKSDLYPTLSSIVSDDIQRFYTSNTSGFEPLKLEVCVVDTSTNTLINPSTNLIDALKYSVMDDDEKYNFLFSHLIEESAPVFKKYTYYTYNTETLKYILLDEKPNDWSTNWKNYYIKSVRPMEYILFSDFSYQVTNTSLELTESTSPNNYVFNVNNTLISVRNGTKYRFVTKVLNGENLNISKYGELN